MWRSAVVATVLAACGRIDFSPLRADTGSGTGDASADGTNASCAAGDGVCRVSCLATDPDCITTCGDSTCVGNAGESCATCAECNTKSIVCGNEDCQAGEDSDTCYQDCGPSPWTWAAEEDELLVRINTVRAAGYACPNATYGPVGALAAYPSSQLVAREAAWAMAHQTNGGMCTGRTLVELTQDANASCPCGLWFIGAANAADALTAFLSNPVICDDIMKASFTRVGVGAANDVVHRFWLILD